MATKEKPETTAAAEKMVKIKLPLERGGSTEEFISINERTWQVQKGVEVEVPECVAAMLADREDMLDKVAAYERQVQK